MLSTAMLSELGVDTAAFSDSESGNISEVTWGSELV
jgi:hypothetical protein